MRNHLVSLSRKSLVTLLAIAMCFSSLPVTALAEPEAEDQVPVVEIGEETDGNASEDSEDDVIQDDGANDDVAQDEGEAEPAATEDEHAAPTDTVVVDSQGDASDDLTEGDADSEPLDTEDESVLAEETNTLEETEAVGEPEATEEPAAIEEPDATETDDALATQATATIKQSGTCGSVYWTLDSNGVLTLCANGKSGTLASSINPWYQYRESITSVTAKAKVTFGESCYGLFQYCKKLTSVDVSKWNTSGVKDMSRMFQGCTSLKSLNLSGLNTSSVTTMASMFRGDYSLTSLNLSNWKTSRVTDMSNMFYDCKKLATLTVTGWDTSSVTTMEGMFWDCAELTALAVSSWNTAQVTNMSGMFNGCSTLTSLDVSKWNTAQVTNMSWMFYECSKLATLDVSGWKTGSVKSMYFMFNCPELKALDVSKWDTSKVSNMSKLFYECGKLTKLDVSRWNTASATNMSGMFYDCWGLTSLNVAAWNTSKVKDMSLLFEGCSKLTSLDVSRWNTASATNMSGMFNGCSALTSLNVSKWNTAPVMDMSRMFYGCSKLTSLDVSSWNTAAVKDMSWMFCDCESITSLNLSNWKTSAVTNMKSMFNGCSKLASLNVSGWATSKVMYMEHLFKSCYKLASLDLSSWDTSDVTSASSMYSSCSALTTFKVGKKYDTSKSGMVPKPTATNSKWWSTTDKTWYTQAEVAERSGIADTYVRRDPPSISDATVSEIPKQTYTGKAITPKPKVTYNGKTLKEGTDYTLSYADNVRIGLASVTITGKGNYTGKKKVYFSIVQSATGKKDISKATVGKVADQTYTGKAIKPKPKVTYGGTTLKEGTDYTLSYANNVNVGRASITITGRGAYTGTKNVTFGIVAIDISKATVGKVANRTYTGKVIRPKPKVTFGGTTLKEGTDYALSYANNVKLGTATITIIGKGHFKGTKKVTFKIVKAATAKKDISKATVGKVADQTYTGKAIKPKPKVTYGGTTLKEGTDYTLKYANNVKVGTATITITGKGDYIGTKKVTFKIVAAAISKATVGKVADQTYTGKAIKPKPKVTYGGTTLKEGTDYALSYANNVKLGTATITIIGKGHFKGTKKVTFKIVKGSSSAGTWERYGGATALDTGKLVVEADGAFAKGRGGTVIVATSGGYWDALAAAGLAGTCDAPVLITPKDALASQTAAEIRRLAPKRVLVMGGPAAVSDATVKAIKSLVPSTSRVYGATAPDTAVSIYEKGSGWGKTAIIATSKGYWDALSIAPYAWKAKAPIFLTKGTDDIPASALSALKGGGFTRVVIVGGTAAVSEGVANKVKSATGVTPTRLAGANALATSAAIARWELKQGMGLSHMAVATSSGYWDALTAAAVCGKQNSVLVLVSPSGGYEAFDAVYDRKQLVHGHVLGGEAALPKAVWDHVTKA